MSELVELAKQFLRNREGLKKASPTSVQSSSAQGDKSDMDFLEEFKSQNLAIRIRSEVLKEDVYLVSNEGVRDRLKGDGLVCYLPEEVEKLKGLSPEDLKRINMVKKVFQKSKVIKGL